MQIRSIIRPTTKDWTIKIHKVNKRCFSMSFVDSNKKQFYYYRLKIPKPYKYKEIIDGLKIGRKWEFIPDLFLEEECFDKIRTAVGMRIGIEDLHYFK